MNDEQAILAPEVELEALRRLVARLEEERLQAQQEADEAKAQLAKAVEATASPSCAWCEQVVAGGLREFSEHVRTCAQHPAHAMAVELERAWLALPSDEAQRAGKPLDQAIRETLLEWSAKCDAELVRAAARSAGSSTLDAVRKALGLGPTADVVREADAMWEHHAATRKELQEWQRRAAKAEATCVQIGIMATYATRDAAGEAKRG